MADAKCVSYVKNAKKGHYAKYAIRRMSNIDMAIWVSQDASGPQEYRPMSLNNF